MNAAADKDYNNAVLARIDAALAVVDAAPLPDDTWWEVEAGKWTANPSPDDYQWPLSLTRYTPEGWQNIQARWQAMGAPGLEPARLASALSTAVAALQINGPGVLPP